MATVQVGNGFFLDMTWLDIGALSEGQTTFTNATHMTQWFDQHTRDEFFGQFTYDQHGVLAGGTLTTIQEFIDNQGAFEFAGMSVPVASMVDWIESGDTYTAEATMFRGNDTMFGNSQSDALLGFDGNDSIDGGGGNDALSGMAGNDTIQGGAGDDYIVGLEDNDSIDGGVGNDDVNGNTGADTVHGGDGFDFVRGGKDNDLVYGDAGEDTVNGNLGDDYVYGGAGNDNVFGGQGNDHLFGDDGNDFISGDLGNDTLTGGAGADGFFIAVGGGNDRVTDFNSAQGDRVLLASGVQYTTHASGSDMVIELSGGGSLTLAGVSQSSMGDWLVRV